MQERDRQKEYKFLDSLLQSSKTVGSIGPKHTSSSRPKNDLVAEKQNLTISKKWHILAMQRRAQEGAPIRAVQTRQWQDLQKTGEQIYFFGGVFGKTGRGPVP